ncbi:hypothetical protein PINS_up001740 [Pythium insidiosum]|nr:hypothetical protein PINS_up001740 [Pythium insidiosum]
MPYFLALWSNATGPTSKADGDDDDDKSPAQQSDTNVSSDTCDWWIPDVLTKVYSATGDKIVTTDPLKRSGNLHLPSSIDLSLPPGTYRVYLIRNESLDDGRKFRTVLGTTPALTVFPGLNSVHTSFGTTPLIDVKPLSATLQVFPESDRAMVAEAMRNRDGFRDEKYLRSISVEQELEVVRSDLRLALKELEKLKGKKDAHTAERKVQSLQMIAEDLSMQKLCAQEREAMEREREEKERADKAKIDGSGAQVATPGPPPTYRSNTTLDSVEQVVFSYRFHGGAPSPQDRIVVLPADVVRVSDLLRSTILGKLQANDTQQAEAARATMERELVEVEDFFNARISLKTIKKIIWRKIKPYVKCGTGSAALTQSDSYQAATGATDNSFVWDECLNAYQNAPKVAKDNFTYIIRDLLDEVGARKHQLGLKAPEEEDKAEDDTEAEKKKTIKNKDRLAKANKLLRLGLEIVVPANRIQVIEDNGEEIVMGEVVARLGHRFRQGGFFVAKYIRRSGSLNPTESPDGGNNASIVTAGEICRYGPFFVEPELFTYSPRQVAFTLGKVVWKVLSSEQGKLTMKVLGQFYVALLKYFLAVVSLSFNISVLAGNFNINTESIKAIISSFQSRLSKFFGPIEYVMAKINSFFGSFVDDLIARLDIFTIAGECMTGFVLYGVLAVLFAATFVVYIVVQEDLLLKVQKIHTILPFNPGKALLAFIEQIGALLVIPLYLAIKSCVLFIAGNWSRVYHQLNDNPSKALEAFGLYDKATPQCTNVKFARINYGFGIAGIVLITMFLFVFLPLLLLDLFSWVPLSELEEPKRLKKLAHSFNRDDIKAAVHSNADLVEVRKYCPRKVLPGPCFGSFKRHYEDYTSMAFRDLLKKYGSLGLFGIFINIYAHLMFQSIWRSLGVLLGWRLRGPYMYKNALQTPRSRWKIFDVFCLRFNIAWKIQFIKDKMVMPFVNICMVTFGLWGETQWKEFNVEERANECYRMEPSAEVKQLQMMTLHGKIISLFWLCVPETQVLAYLAEVLNRGPVFGYFLNKQFLQADIPDSEREKDPVWRFHSVLGHRGEEDVVYLWDTRFVSTFMKWCSALVEIASLLMVYGASTNNRTILFGITLISAVIAPILELNQQMIKAYMDFVETAEGILGSTGLDKKLDQAQKALETAKSYAVDAPEVGVNLNALERKKRRQQAALAAASAGAGAAAASGAKAPASSPGAATGPGGAPQAGASQTPAAGGANGKPAPADANNARKAAIATTVLGDDKKFELGDDDDDVEDEIEEELEEDDDEDEDGDEEDGNDTEAAALVAAAGILGNSKKQLILLNAMPLVSYVVLTDALDVGEGEITINWQINARQRFHVLDAIGMFPARKAGDFSVRSMDDCICYRLLKDKDAEPFGWDPKNDDTEDAERELIIRQAKSLRDISEREVSKFAKKSIHNVPDAEREERLGKHREQLQRADTMMKTMMDSPKLKPYKKKFTDILEEEVQENRLHLTVSSWNASSKSPVY